PFAGGSDGESFGPSRARRARAVAFALVTRRSRRGRRPVSHTTTLGVLPNEPEPPLSPIAVSRLALDFISQWRRVGMAADYLSSHLAYAFEEREVAHNVLSTVVDELLENAVKFSADGSHPVSIELSHFGERLCIRASNASEQESADAFLA